MGPGVHGVQVAEAVQGGNAPEQVGLIDKGGKEIQALDQPLPGGPIDDGGIIGGVYTGFNPRINDWLKACQCFMEGVAADLGAAAGAVQGVGVRGGGGHGGQVLIELGHEGPVDMILPAPYPVPGHRQAAATTGNGIFAAGG